MATPSRRSSSSTPARRSSTPIRSPAASPSWGGVPNLNPEGLATRSHAEYKDVTELEDMIREDLAAERVAIATYSEIIRWLGDDDPTTRRMMEEILAKEEEHADDLAMLLEPSPRNQAGAQLQALPVGQTRFPTR